MKNCKAISASGKPCRGRPLRGSDYCFTHDPANAKKRAQARRLGGQRSRIGHSAAQLPAQVRTLDQAREILEYTLAEIEPHENSIARARVLIALFDSFVKALEIGSLEERIAALEARKV